MKKIFLIIVLCLLSNSIFSQISEIKGVLPIDYNINRTTGVMLFYPDTTTIPWIWYSVYDENGISSVKQVGNLIDSTFTVTATGTAQAFPSISCKWFTIMNNEPDEIVYIGSSSNVTYGIGMWLDYGETWTVTPANASQYYYISDGTNANIIGAIEN